MVDESGCQEGRDEQPEEDGKARAFAEKFNLSLDKARRLIELHRAVRAREAKKPKKR
jgi:hypothetical protein